MTDSINTQPTGRAAKRRKHENCCHYALRVLGMSDNEIAAMQNRAGWPTIRQGNIEWQRVLDAEGWLVQRMHHQDGLMPTLAAVMRAGIVERSDAALVLTPGHGAAVVDGEVIDTVGSQPMRRRVELVALRLATEVAA